MQTVMWRRGVPTCLCLCEFMNWWSWNNWIYEWMIIKQVPECTMMILSWHVCVCVCVCVCMCHGVCVKRRIETTHTGSRTRINRVWKTERKYWRMQNNCTTSDRFRWFVFQRCRLLLVVKVEKKNTVTRCKYATLYGYETVAQRAIILQAPVPEHIFES